MRTASLKSDRAALGLPVLRRRTRGDEGDARDDRARLARIEAELARLSAPLDAAPLLSSPGISVHPLGGAPMAACAEEGGVDHRGRVFAGASGDAVHPGRFVLDGAGVPCTSMRPAEP